MGNQLSIIPPDRFRDQIFSIVLYYVAPKANSNLKFSIREKCTPDNLPMPDDPDYQKMLDFYNLTDKQVMDYVNTHILNSEENLARFYQTLITNLKGSSNNQPALYKAGLNSRDSDKLTRSRLDQIGSRQPSLASEYRSRRQKSHFTKTEVLKNDVESRKTGGRRDSSEKVKRTNQERNETRGTERMTERGTEIRGTNHDLDLSSVELTKKQLIDRFLMENPDGYMNNFEEGIDSNFEADLEGDDDGFGESAMMRRSRSRSRSRSRRSLMNDDYHEGMDEVHYNPDAQGQSERSDVGTLKHSRRFGDKCVIE